MASEKASPAALGAAGRGALQLAKRIALAGRALIRGRLLAPPARRVWLVDPQRAPDRKDGAQKKAPSDREPPDALAELSRLSQLGRSLERLLQRALLLKGPEAPRRGLSTQPAALQRELAARAVQGPQRSAPAFELRAEARPASAGLAPPAPGAVVAPLPQPRPGATPRTPEAAAARRETPALVAFRLPRARSTVARDPESRVIRHDVRFMPFPATPRSPDHGIPPSSPERVAPGARPAEAYRSEPQREPPGEALSARFSLPERLHAAGFGWLEDTARRVRLHTDAGADRRAQSLRADAVTLGHDIYFRYDKFDPGSPRGMSLIAHELVHVAQQGDVMPPGPLVAQRLEADAVRTEHRVYRLLAAPPAAPALPGPPRALPAREWSVPQARQAPASRAPAPAAPAPLPAAEDRAAPAAADAGNDPHAIAAQVYHLLHRRLRIDRERLGLGRL